MKDTHGGDTRTLVGTVGYSINIGTGCDWLEEDGLFGVGCVDIGEVDG